MKQSFDLTTSPLLKKRRVFDQTFRALCMLTSILGCVVLAVLLYNILDMGLGRLNWDFLKSFPSRFPERAGIKAAMFGTAWLMVFTLIFTVPIGVGAAIFIEEFMRPSRIKKIIEINIANLAGVPSIIYGMLGLALFVRLIQLERSVLAGALTLSTLILPIVIITTREALRAVPSNLREASLALGATPIQTVFRVVLPAATPGMMTGILLALSRAIGETAPLIMIGVPTFIAFTPSGPMDTFTALPMQIFNWAQRPQEEFQANAGAGIIVLLFLLLLMNSVAIFIRQKYSSRARN